MSALPDSSRRWQYKESHSFLLVCLIRSRMKRMNQITVWGMCGFWTLRRELSDLSDTCHLCFTKAGRNLESGQGHTKKHVPDPRLWEIWGLDCIATVWVCLWNQEAKFLTSHFRSPLEKRGNYNTGLMTAKQTGNWLYWVNLNVLIILLFLISKIKTLAHQW